MGHSSIQVTVDLYGHLIPGGNKQAVDRLALPVDKPRLGLTSATPAQPIKEAERTSEREGLVDQAVIVRRYGVSDGFLFQHPGEPAPSTNFQGAVAQL